MAEINLLTVLKVKAAGPGWHADGANLYLRVGKDGKRRRWIYRFTRGAKTTEIGLGAANAVSLKHVRDERQRITEALAKGEDTRRKFEESAKTFAVAARFVIERDRQHWGATSINGWTRSLEVDARRLANIPVASVTVEDVKQTVMPMFDRGDHMAARRTLSRIEAVLDCADAHGWRKSDNAAAWKIFKHIAPKRPPADRRHAALDWREAPAAFARMRTSDTLPAACLALIALTATRLTEARAARWGEIDFERAEWTIPVERMKTRNKTREPHVVPLSKAALDLLTRLKERQTGDFVFPGQNMRQPISHTTVWQVCRRLSDDRASPHGFRSTFRSWCADNGVDREVAESALAHTIGGVEGAYNRAAMVERRRRVMTDWGAFLAGETAAAKVVPFKGAGR